MTSKPFFSIVIPTLNEEQFLPRLLSDLKTQTFRDFEVIIVDGYSEDKTKTQASRHRSLPGFQFHQVTTRNVSYQRNFGGKHAKDEWIIFMDADDRLPSYFLLGLKYRIEEKQPHVFSCYCEVDSDELADKTIEAFINLTSETSFRLNKPTAWGTLIGCQRSIFNKSHGFNTATAFAEDTEFVQTLAHAHRFELFTDPKYIQSLRRYRKTGRLKTVRQYVNLHLKILTKTAINQAKEYPMGGGIYTNQAGTFTLNRKYKPLTLPQLIQKFLNLPEKK